MPLSRKAKSRLTKLIAFMKRLPKSANNHFDMGRYFRHTPVDDTHDHGIKHDSLVSRKTLTQCGTTACALGWAATVPEFQRAGLRMRADGQVFMRGEDPEYAYCCVTAQTFFDIGLDEAEALFEAHTHIKTPREWAKYAECMVREWNERDR